VPNTKAHPLASRPGSRLNAGGSRRWRGFRHAAVKGLKSRHVPDTIVTKSQTQLHSAADKVLYQFTMFLDFEFIDECTCSARRSGVFSSRAWPVQEMKTQGMWMVSLRMKIGEVGSMTETKPKR